MPQESESSLGTCGLPLVNAGVSGGVSVDLPPCGEEENLTKILPHHRKTEHRHQKLINGPEWMDTNKGSLAVSGVAGEASARLAFFNSRALLVTPGKLVPLPVPLLAWTGSAEKSLCNMQQRVKRQVAQDFEQVAACCGCRPHGHASVADMTVCTGAYIPKVLRKIHRSWQFLIGSNTLCAIIKITLRHMHISRRCISGHRSRQFNTVYTTPHQQRFLDGAVHR